MLLGGSSENACTTPFTRMAAKTPPVFARATTSPSHPVQTATETCPPLERSASVGQIFSKGRSNHFLPARSTRASPYDKPLPYCPNLLAAALVAAPSSHSTTQASSYGSSRVLDAFATTMVAAPGAHRCRHPPRSAAPSSNPPRRYQPQTRGVTHGLPRFAQTR